MEEVTLEQVLAARDARTQRQNALMERYHMPVISFSMNIPGPVKDTPLIRRAYDTGRDALLGVLKNECVKVLRKEENQASYLIDMSEYPSGTYMLTTSDGATHKIVKK